MVKATEHNLDAFAWLRLEKWTPETIFNFYYVEGKRMCKICDEWVLPAKEASHVKGHVRHRKLVLKVRALEAEERRLEALKLAREERKRIKELGL